MKLVDMKLLAPNLQSNKTNALTLILLIRNQMRKNSDAPAVLPYQDVGTSLYQRVELTDQYFKARHSLR